MKTFKIILLLLASGLLLTGCPEEGGDILTFINQSDRDLFICVREHESEESLQSDTLLPVYKLGTPVLRRQDKSGGKDWIVIYFDDSVYAKSIFVMNLDTVCKYPWDTIRNRYMVLKRYDLRRDEALKMDIIYK